ncbi:MAG: ABC transporter permease [Planctomycetes bacterium]|nr:ABC transporter permease [Planctomycetota bacterium]MCC7171599.1 ABC transporter permease [Planctomycetota bacterium]
MALVPLNYNLRSLIQRRTSTFLTALALGATVATVAGVLALQQGFETLFTKSGRDDVVVFLRKGAASEGESAFTRDDTRYLVNSITEIAKDASGKPIAAVESFLALRRRKMDGGETNVPVRGVSPMSFDLMGDRLKITSGRTFQPSSDEVIIGAKLAGRIQNTLVGDTIVFNMTPFKVVGIFENDGPAGSEVWGDVERIIEALDRPLFNRVIAKLADSSPDALAAFNARMQADVQSPCEVKTEAEYLAGLTGMLSGLLQFVGSILGSVMGIAAVFTATNTMLSAIASRTHEIGILLATGFRPIPIFLSFMFESLVLGVFGGAIGCLLVLPVNGIETGTSNFATFTEVAFAFKITPQVLTSAVIFSLVLGLLAGAWPAWKAAMMKPTEALRRS